jgi:hypothetical protein
MRAVAAWELIFIAWVCRTWVIQRILRHANVSTTTAYYIKPVANDVRDAIAKLETSVPDLDTRWTPDAEPSMTM